jgi:hypothetical protein
MAQACKTGLVDLSPSRARQEALCDVGGRQTLPHGRGSVGRRPASRTVRLGLTADRNSFALCALRGFDFHYLKHLSRIRPTDRESVT